MREKIADAGDSSGRTSSIHLCIHCTALYSQLIPSSILQRISQVYVVVLEPIAYQ